MRAWRNITLNFALALGDVSIAVGVVPGVREERVSFTTLHDKCGQKVKQSWFCESCNEYFSGEDTAKGIEVDGSFVKVLDSELAATETPFDAAVRFTKFVPQEDVASMLIDDSYWLTPGKDDRKNYYGIFHEAMREKKVAAIGRSSISKMEHIVCVTPVDGGFAMFNLSSPTELVKPDWELQPSDTKAVKAAKLYIEEFTGELEPSDFVRHDLERKKELVAAKQDSKPVKVTAKITIPPPPADLIATLRANVEAARKAKAKKSKTKT
jgi:DNA end-binding protein Ku